jgi:hypothetical protein
MGPTITVPPEVSRRLAEDRPVELPWLANQLGVNRATRREAVDSGLLTPLTGGRGKAQTLSIEDARRFAAAAVIAAFGGLALLIVLRVLAGSGADIGGGGVRIPVQGIST